MAFHPRTQRLRKRRERQLRAIRPSRRNELWYRAELGKIVRHLRAAGAALASGLQPHWPQVQDSVPLGFDFLLTQQKAKFQNIRKVATGLATEAANRTASEVDDRLAGAIQTSLGVDIRGVLAGSNRNAQELRAAIKANVELIESIPEQYFDRLREVVGEAFETGQSWKEIVAKVQEIGDVTESRAALIARDQTSKLNAAFNSGRQRELGIEKYTWDTAHDERVRDSHAEMDGETCRWDAPPDVDGERVHPGEAINCRCVAVPSFDIDEAPAESPIAAELEQEAA